MRHLIVAALLSSTALIPTASIAQTERQKAPAASSAATTSQGQVNAEQFVREAAISDMFEIQSSQLAGHKSQDQKVKQFATDVTQDHTKASNELKSAAQEAKSVQVPNALDDEHKEKLQQLQQANGRQFDQLYAQMQLQGHQKAVGLFQNYAQNGDNPQLKQFAQKTLPVLQHHLQMAENLPEVRAEQNQPGQQAQESGRVVVQEPAPSVRVEQAAPQVTVQQPRPQVSVRQPQPEITVRMPPPTITVQQPQPEITVRMPNPEVKVTMPQPHVAVNQPQPKVQVEQPKEAPQVQVQREQPQVQLQPGQEANVNVEKAQQPQVHFEQNGQPKVQYSMTGQPKVNYEQAEPGDTQHQARTTQDEERAAARQQAVRNQQAARQDTTTGATQPAEAAQGQRQPVTAAQIDKMKLYNDHGDQLGNVDHVILGSDNEPHIVIGHGGFLGLGEKQVAIPLGNTVVRGDRLVTHGVTDDQIKAMASWDSKAGNYQELKGNQTVEVTVVR
jgi:predicted outer membrane protein